MMLLVAIITILTMLMRLVVNMISSIMTTLDKWQQQGTHSRSVLSAVCMLVLL